MSSLIYYRMFGQGLTITMQATNYLIMFISMQDEEFLKDPQIREMTSLESRYITVWNIVIQISYFSLAFACDFLTVTGRDNIIPKTIRRFRQTFFSSLVFPVAMLIFTLFWPIFIVKRELLYAEYVDKIFSFKSNLVMHFFILPSALWELILLPPFRPPLHATNLGILVFLYVVYNAIVLHTYYQRGLFPYPILHMINGTIYYPIFIIFLFFLALGIYVFQCKLTNLIWGVENNKMQVKFS